ncbi:hypothetical protein D3C80_1872560 [compost metagenome]
MQHGFQLGQIDFRYRGFLLQSSAGSIEVKMLISTEDILRHNLFGDRQLGIEGKLSRVGVAIVATIAG